MELGRRAGLAAEPLVHAALLHHSLEPLRHSSGLGRLAWQVVGGDDARRIADIVQVCNLVDEQLEALEFEYKEIDVILEEIQSFAALEGFDPAVVEYVREMRCGEIPGGFRLPVEGGAAGRVFRELSARREYEIRELETIALRDPVLSGSLVGVANSALYGRAHRVSTVGAGDRLGGSERGAQDHAGGCHAPAVCVSGTGTDLESFAERGSALFGAGQPHGSAEFGGRAGLRAGARHRRRGGAASAARGAGDVWQAGRGGVSGRVRGAPLAGVRSR